MMSKISDWKIYREHESEYKCTLTTPCHTKIFGCEDYAIFWFDIVFSTWLRFELSKFLFHLHDAHST